MHILDYRWCLTFSMTHICYKITPPHRRWQLIKNNNTPASGVLTRRLQVVIPHISCGLSSAVIFQTMGQELW